MYKLNLSEVDTDGALQEAEAAVAGDTRLDFLRKAGIGGGVVMGGGAVLAALAPTAMGAVTGQVKGHGRPPATLLGLKLGKGDIGILNYALVLEYLESAFYNQALANIKFTDPALKALNAKIAADEAAHVAFLKAGLGRKAVASPKFNFGPAVTDQPTFAAVAQKLENTGVGAYFGQGFNVENAKILKAAISILTIEARHAGAIGFYNDAIAKVPVANSVSPNGSMDKPATAKATVAGVLGTHFIAGT